MNPIEGHNLHMLFAESSKLLQPKVVMIDRNFKTYSDTSKQLDPILMFLAFSAAISDKTTRNSESKTASEGVWTL